MEHRVAEEQELYATLQERGAMKGSYWLHENQDERIRDIVMRSRKGVAAVKGQWPGYTGIGRAQTFLMEGRFSEAEKNVISRLREDPESERLWAALSTAYELEGNADAARRCNTRAEQLRLRNFLDYKRPNAMRIRDIVRARGIPLVLMQYPRCRVDPLRSLAGPGVYFVENRDNFNAALARGKASDIFMDLFGGDFGHCTAAGNALIADRLADAILNQVIPSQKR
jgi:hypothetical protein